MTASEKQQDPSPLSSPTRGEESKIKSVSGRALPLPGNDIDTDRIIPARYMKCVTFDELGQYAFYDARFNEDGSKKDHPFNDERYKGASLTVVGNNFGCGSSREHAPQSLLRWGIKAIIGESFAEIFADNCVAIGIPVARVEKADAENLMAFVREDPACEVKIDMERKEVIYGDFSVPFQVPEHARKALVRGTWDTTAELLSAEGRIRDVSGRLPYLNHFKS